MLVYCSLWVVKIIHCSNTLSALLLSVNVCYHLQRHISSLQSHMISPGNNFGKFQNQVRFRYEACGRAVQWETSTAMRESGEPALKMALEFKFKWNSH